MPSVAPSSTDIAHTRTRVVVFVEIGADDRGELEQHLPGVLANRSLVVLLYYRQRHKREHAFVASGEIRYLDVGAPLVQQRESTGQHHTPRRLRTHTT